MKRNRSLQRWNRHLGTIFPGDSPLEIAPVINLRIKTNFKWLVHVELCHFTFSGTFQPPAGRLCLSSPPFSPQCAALEIYSSPYRRQLPSKNLEAFLVPSFHAFSD